MEKLRERVREGNELVRFARINALDSTIAIDEMLSSIIAEYFVDEYSKRDLLFEVLSILTTLEKVEVFSLLETPKGVQFGKRYKGIIRRLKLLNAYRNAMVHGYPSLSFDPKLWIGRGKFRAFPINKRVVQKMEKVGDKTYDSLSNIFKRMVDAGRRMSDAGGNQRPSQSRGLQEEPHSRTNGVG